MTTVSHDDIIRETIIVDAPAQKAIDVVLDLSTVHEWEKSIVSRTTIERLSPRFYDS